VAKIEDQQAVKNIDEIISQADAIMVARGDLGIECPYEELPIIQRKVVKSCLRVGRPVIVATHMLESMIQNPMPTRAEITDVANAVFEQSDAIMLSGETTVGKYPTECVEVFDKIARRIERSGGANFQEHAALLTARQKLVKSAVVMANELRAEAILVFTRQGNMAQYTSWMRPRSSAIYAACPNEELARRLVINWGVTPLVISFDNIDPDRTVSAGLECLRQERRVEKGDTVVVIGAISADGEIVDAVQMRTIP
jgi:pyruvate kinase